jgi:thiamine phosphate synthase YjbQ (UPF0047 family)
LASRPTQIRLALTPGSRFDAIDVTQRIRADFGDVLRRHRRSLYSSLHTTAGYIEHGLAARLLHHRDRLSQFFSAFGAVFPANAPYRHDEMDQRSELSEEQRRVEPKNGDSHLTFIGAGMRNCVTYPSDDSAPVYFIDLDGVNAGTRRRRLTDVLGYDNEESVARRVLSIPVSRHSIDSVNLADPDLGLLDMVEDLIARSGIEKGRVDIALLASERNVGLTVNEYETLLMQHDLAEVLRDPLRFAAQKGRHALGDPLAIPGKARDYATYDMVRLLNSLLEALKVDESVVERLVAKAMAVPARRFLRRRRVSFLASDQGNSGRARLVRGTYQSPILVQWQAATSRVRQVEVTLMRLS